MTRVEVKDAKHLKPGDAFRRLSCSGRGSNTKKHNITRHQEYPQGEKHMNRLLLAGAAAVMVLAGNNASFAAGKKTLAVVVNGGSHFWKAAGAGGEKGQGGMPDYKIVFKNSRQAS